jgi:cytosine/adenosine deaminase-related metal-dependent hydrolase
MRYRKLKADKLFDGYRFWENKVLVVAENGIIEGLIEDAPDAEYFNGILMPGMINCHCHLELSHMKGVVPERKGLVDFLLNVMRVRKEMIVDKQPFIITAEKEMHDNGIVGVADICNTNDAIEVKKQSAIRWHSLIEIINLRNENLGGTLEKNEAIKKEHEDVNLKAVLTPHAPYSVSQLTFEEINQRTVGQIISVHNQESEAENELFQKGTGDFLKLYSSLGSTSVPFDISGKNSLQTWLPYFTNGQTILLVHNTYIKEKDILFAKEHAATHGLNLVYCLCPNANLYIENNVPPIDLLIKHDCKIVLGTDSLSSNWQLSIASEIKTIKEKFSHLSLETILQWAISNAASIMQWNDFGSFEKGKKPGVVLLNEEDFSSKRIL